MEINKDNRLVIILTLNLILMMIYKSHLILNKIHLKKMNFLISKSTKLDLMEKHKIS
jgi:hypothetical protein